MEDDKMYDFCEIKEDGHICLKILCFAKMKGWFIFEFLKIILISGKTQNPIEYDTPEICII